VCSLLDAGGAGALDFHGLFVERALWLLGLGGVNLLQLGAHVLFVESRFVEPRVALEFFHSVSVFAVVAKQFEDHVLKIGWQASSVDLFEIGFNLTGQEEVVEVLFLARLLEWEDALNDNEHNNANTE